MRLHFKSPSVEQMKVVERLINELELDDQNLNREDFIIALDNNGSLLGFVRIKKHSSCYELCSLGVVDEARGKGIGWALVKEVVNMEINDLYLTCIIPTYFSNLGFKKVSKSVPEEMLAKTNYCASKLPVEGKQYVIMKYIGHEKG